jgi:hypothetical protein
VPAEEDVLGFQVPPGDRAGEVVSQQCWFHEMTTQCQC